MALGGRDNLLLTRRRERSSSLNNHLILEDDDLSAGLIIKFPTYFKQRLKATVQPPTHTLSQFEWLWHAGLSHGIHSCSPVHPAMLVRDVGAWRGLPLTPL